MRRLPLLLVGAAIWLFLLAIPALADNSIHTKGHGQTPAECAGCHRAHSAAAPDILVQPLPNLCYTCHGSGTTGSTLDVQDGQRYSTGAHTGLGDGVLRGGGFDYALINTAAWSGSGFGALTIGVLGAPAATTSAHSVDGSLVTMWGNGALGANTTGTADVELTCGSCHDPHGNGQYRILKPAPNDSGIGANSRASNWADGGRVYINDGPAKTYTTTNYGNVQVVVTPAGSADSLLNSDGSALWYSPDTKNWYGSYTETASRWCATCHTRYMSHTDSAIQDSGDTVYAFRHAIRNIVDPNNGGFTTTSVTNPISGDGPATIAVINPATAGNGVTNPTLTANGVATGLSGHVDQLSSSAPKCITCHVSHGSNATMAQSILDQWSPGINLSGNVQVQGGTPLNVHLDSTLLRLNNRGVCQACHNL